MNNPRRIQRHLVKALAAGALLAAAALPMAIATAAGAADVISSTTFSISGGNQNLSYFGQGASGTFTVNGTFAGLGGTTTVTSTAPGVTFSSVTNVTGTTVTGSFASTSATVPGSYAVTVTDGGGTATETGAFVVYGDPSVTSALTTTGSSSSIADVATPAAIPVTISGAGFVANGVAANPKVTFTSTVDGTKLAVGAVAGGGATETTPTSTLTTTVTPVVAVNGTPTTTPATPGTYTVTVTNADGGSFTSGPIFTIVGNEIAVLSPSAVPVTPATYAFTIYGGGFQSGATVAFSPTCTDVTLGTATVTSGSTITDSAIVATGATAEQCSLEVTNTGNNGASFIGTDALGIGMGSDLAPVITASSLTTATALVAGAPSTTITFTGEGFSSFTTPVASTYGSANTADLALTVGAGCIANSSGTSLTCPIAIPNNETAGAHTANLENNSGTTGSTGSLANAFTADGPAITAAAPAALATGAAIGTVVTLTGTEFNNTSSGTVTDSAIVGTHTLAGTFQYVSATTEDFVVTGSPSIADNGDTLQVKSVDAYGDNEFSAPFALGIDNAPTVSSITYATGTTGVGIGAKTQTVTINGTGFETGVKVGAFTNASGTADAAVTATVVSVNTLGTTITATVAITSPDTNTIDGYTVTNPDGGTAKALAVAPAGLTIDAAPTITAVSPVTASASSTNAFTITGTGFLTGATVTLSSDGTCGTATVASATSITVSCTLGAAGSAAVTLSVVNPDGGTATSGTILAAKTTTTSSFRVTGAHGTAIAGKTVTMTISGTGFYGQPKITSTAAGTKVGVSKDTGKLLTIRVTTKAGIRGEHTFTIRLANGKTGKANYAVKA